MTADLSRAEYRDLRTSTAAAARERGGSHLYQHCNRCGHCEVAGGFCSWCTTAAYTLTPHYHGQREACPLSQPETGQGRGILGTYRHPAAALSVVPA